MTSYDIPIRWRVCGRWTRFTHLTILTRCMFVDAEDVSPCGSQALVDESRGPPLLAPLDSPEARDRRAGERAGASASEQGRSRKGDASSKSSPGRRHRCGGAALSAGLAGATAAASVGFHRGAQPGHCPSQSRTAWAPGGRRRQYTTHGRRFAPREQQPLLCGCRCRCGTGPHEQRDSSTRRSSTEYSAVIVSNCTTSAPAHRRGTTRSILSRSL